MPLNDHDQEHVDALIGQVRQYGSGVTLYELVQHLKARGVDVDGELGLPAGYENVVLWTGLSEQAATIIGTVLGNHDVEASPSMRLVYLYDGAAPNIPDANMAQLAKGYKYKKLHWLPIALGIKRSERGS